MTKSTTKSTTKSMTCSAKGRRRSLPYGAALLACVLSLAGCDEGNKSSGPASNGTTGSSPTVDPTRLNSPLTMDLSRPAQKEIALAKSLELRKTVTDHARKLMAPSHGKWLAPSNWPHYQTCKEQYINALGNGSLSVDASGDTLKVAGTVDLRDCIEIRKSPIEQGSVQIYGKLQCKGSDLGSFDGAALAQLTEMPCKDATDVHFIAQSIVDIKAKVRVAGIVPIEVNIKEQHSLADGNGQGCHYVGTETKLNFDQSCHAIAKIAYASPYKLPVIGLPLNKTEFVKASFDDVSFVADTAMPWYENRSAKLEVNGWDGDVSYSGVNNSPSYSLKRGAAKVDGNL